MSSMNDHKDKKHENHLFFRVNSVVKFILGLLIWFPSIFKYLLGILENVKFIPGLFSREELTVLWSYRYFIYASIIILSAMIFKGKNKVAFIFWYLIYILGFPFVFIFKILYRYIPTSVIMFGILYAKFKSTKKLKNQFYILLLDFLCIYLIIKTNTIWIIYINILLLFIFLMTHLYFIFSLITNPLSMVNKGYLFVFNKLWDYFKEELILKKIKNKDNKNEEDNLRSNIKLLGKVYNYFNDKVGIIYNKQAILIIFIFLFFLALSLTSIIFSFEYYALAKIANNFLVFGDIGFIDFLFYSISNISTINSEIIFPQSLLAKVLVLAQTFIGIFIFYIFIVSFTALSPDVFKETSKIREKISNKYLRIKDFLNKTSTEELNISLEELIKERLLDLKKDKKKKDIK